MTVKVSRIIEGCAGMDPSFRLETGSTVVVFQARTRVEFTRTVRALLADLVLSLTGGLECWRSLPSA